MDPQQLDRLEELLNPMKKSSPSEIFKHETKKAHGLRYNDGKLKWSYVHFKSLEPMVRVLMFGAQKYEPFNWQKGLKKDEILESMMRHVAALIDGEENDPESGLPHIGHIQCNTMFYQYMRNKELEELKRRESDKSEVQNKISNVTRTIYEQPSRQG